MLFTQRSTIIPTAALVAASLLTLTSAAPSSMGHLARRGNNAMEPANVKDGDKPKPPPNPANQGEPQTGPTNMYTLTWNDPATSVDSVANFPEDLGGKKDSGFGGYCRDKDSYGCLAMKNGNGGVMTAIYQCTEIESSEAGKKATVWKKSSTCQDTDQGYGRMARNICAWNGKGPDCKPINWD